MKKMIYILFALLFCSCAKEKQVNSKRPIDKNATQATVQLYNRLFKLMDKGIMLCHQDDLAYGHGWYKEAGRSDVKDVTGDYPAMIGWELGHVEIDAAYNLDSIYFSDMKQYIRDTHKRGGLTTISWHGDNIATGNTAWDCKQDTVVTSILPGGIHHEQYLLWLDRVGDFFLDLNDEQGNPIPVIFRMYHEHTGNWFWWCREQCTPEEYKQLWIMTVNYLRDKKNVHNLLYAYSPAIVSSESEYLERYPGDEYVDIVGFDCYASANELDRYIKEMDTNLKIVTDYATKSGKLPIVAETGLESIPDTTYFTERVYPVIDKYKISWILFWRNAWDKKMENHFYVPYKGHPAENDFREFVNKENILMNKDLQ